MQINEELYSRLAQLLAGGPVVIGETHDQAYARTVIEELMNRKAVKFFSFESWMGSPATAGPAGQLMDAQNHFTVLAPAMESKYPIVNLASLMQAQGIPFYCHDLPPEKNRLQTANPGYNAQAVQFLPPGLQGQLPKGSKVPVSVSWTGARNLFSANYLRGLFGNGVKVLVGLVVLAGSAHLIGAKCSRADRTLQACLGIPDTRACIIEFNQATFVA